MEQWIRNVLDLQEVDIRIRKLLIRLEMIPKEQKEIKKEIVEEEQSLETKKTRSLQAASSIKSCEVKTSQLKEQIVNLEKQSSMVKNNEQYKAMTSEIEHLKKQISELETTEIELFDEQEDADAEYKDIAAKFATRIDNLKEEIAELGQLSDDIKAQIKDLSGQRPALKAKIPAETLRIYERLIAKGEGLPLAMIVSGNCGNCHLKVIPQTLYNAQAKKLTTCDYCSHMLYVGE
ncbi:hypothetical protein AAEX28_04595 [Lentisphaerota bacterium WC36G]|nr:hypothetical protein LJT99_07455 [Lentisphaerae bacterium WC36]